MQYMHVFRQWRFVDNNGLHRFRHKGDTIIPGAGVRWKHLPLPKPPKVGKVGVGQGQTGKPEGYISSDSESDSDSDSGGDQNKRVAAEKDKPDDGHLEDVPLGGGSKADDEDDNGDGAIVTVDSEDDDEPDEDELPWQVIALLDRSVLEDLRFSSACRDEKVGRALRGLDVQQPCQSTTVEGFLEAERRALRSIESGGGGAFGGSSYGNDNDDDDNDSDVAPQGWLYRVVAEDGVKLFTAPPDGIYVNESDEEEEGVVADVNMNEESDSDDANDDNGPRVVGMRSKDDYVRIIEQKGSWLCLAHHEPPLRDVPLQVGDKVKVVSGHYKGETGEITEEASVDTKEFGVHLDGYKGTGKLHAACMVRNGPHPLSRSAVLVANRKKAHDARLRREERRRKREAREREREIMRTYYGDAYADYLPHYYDDNEEEMSSEGSESDEDDEDGTDIPDYDDGYKGKLWVQITQSEESAGSSLVRIPEHSVASLKIGSESCHAELYDKPFEPRLEGGSTHSTSSDIGDGDEDTDNLVQNEEDEEAQKPFGSVLLNSVSNDHNAALAPQSADGTKLVVGLPVQLCDLNSHARYNGRTGVVITRANVDGRFGVRLDPSLNTSIEECDKKLLLLPKNIAPVAVQSTLDVSEHLTSEEQEHAARAARILNIHIDAIGLGNSHVESVESKKVLDLFLRSTERTTQPHRPRVLNYSAQQLQNESLQEARKAHSALSIGIEKVSKARNGTSQDCVVGASPLALSPTAIIEAGLLGERAKAALAIAAESHSFDQVETCLNVLRGVLKDEQARIFRACTKSGDVPSTILDWKLEKAEKDAASDRTETIESNDCLLIRLAMISILFDASRLAQASKASKEASEIYTNSGAVQLWRGRCLISEGLRIEGIESINKCVTFGPHSGPGGCWAHREGVKRLRSLKRTLVSTDFQLKSTCVCFLLSST